MHKYQKIKFIRSNVSNENWKSFREKKYAENFAFFWHFVRSRKMRKFSRNFASYYFDKKCEILTIHEMRKLCEKNNTKILRKKMLKKRKFCEKTVHFKDSLLSWLAGFGWTYVDGQKLRKIENSNSLHQTFTKI